ncbi:DNA-(apurinic or apyrimidinic site) lyase, chloroplastic [Canna indica]|uniref:DNA-(apurinic or apyrimidinic site) endonuclease n=1 Tax=Canna indica TaxID=4628 RepID=A0AAQ3Q569_9LILI|nr:DNA-(apurinic or apyrimidinic site) lyase, chloroplastic [Canna indica]
MALQQLNLFGRGKGDGVFLASNPPLMSQPPKSMVDRLFCGARVFIPRIWGSGSPTMMKLKGSSSDLPRVNLSSSLSAMSAHENGKKQKISGSCMTRSKSSGKEDAKESNAGLEILWNNSSRLGIMTINELRTLAKSVGIPPKGSKKDLVAALHSLSTKGEENVRFAASATPDHVSTEKDLLSNDPVLPSNSASKRKAKALLSDNNAQILITVSEVSKGKQKRSKRKQHLTEDTLREESSIIRSDGVIMEQMGTEMHGSEPWAKLAHKKPQAGWIPYNPKTMRPLHPTNDIKFVKILSWNVNGLRALLKLDGFPVVQLAEKEDFDVLCLQETKMKENDVEKIKDSLIEGYNNSYWTCSVSKLGYSGTAIISRIKPISVRYGLGIPDHDGEGRLVTVEFDTFYLISAYVPNSGDGLKRLTYRVKEWDPSLSRYIKELEQSKPVILTGDLNCAHEEIDIYNPAGNRRSAGFTWEERESFQTNFLSKGFVDTFRRQHPNAVGYTYWGYRHGGRKTNKGWRLDYFLVSENIADKAYDSYICPDVSGSDHCPVGLILKL